MHLSAAPSAAAGLPGCAQAQLDSLARSVEARRLQLEADIDAYIARKQDELRRYETELAETLRAMAGDGDEDGDGHQTRIESRDASSAPPSPAAPTAPTASAASAASSPDEHRKKKHGRVHKREQELYGLVTPVFLPLLDARDATAPDQTPTPTPAKKPARPQDADGSAHRQAPAPPGAIPADMPAGTPAPTRRRSSLKKKSALRHGTAPRNRKRVSLAIDDYVVLPSDVIAEPALASPASDDTSPSASTASLDLAIDPRLTRDGPVFIEHSDAHHGDAHHSDAVHHSLPPAGPPPAAVRSPPTSPYAPPSYASRSFLDPPPAQLPLDDLPHAASPAPIYPASDTPEATLASSLAPSTDDGFQTYVGGISGSGVDDVNQVGSVGYPSSLGASYLESYMQGRPLSVRMAAAEREGDASELSKLRGLEERRKMREKKEERREDDDWSKPPPRARDADDDDFMGSMDDF